MISALIAIFAGLSFANTYKDWAHCSAGVSGVNENYNTNNAAMVPNELQESYGIPIANKILQSHRVAVVLDNQLNDIIRLKVSAELPTFLSRKHSVIFHPSLGSLFLVYEVSILQEPQYWHVLIQYRDGIVNIETRLNRHALSQDEFERTLIEDRQQSHTHGFESGTCRGRTSEHHSNGLQVTLTEAMDITDESYRAHISLSGNIDANGYTDRQQSFVQDLNLLSQESELREQFVDNVIGSKSAQIGADIRIFNEILGRLSFGDDE